MDIVTYPETSGLEENERWLLPNVAGAISCIAENLLSKRTFLAAGNGTRAPLRVCRNNRQTGMTTKEEEESVSPIQVFTVAQ